MAYELTQEQAQSVGGNGLVAIVVEWVLVTTMDYALGKAVEFYKTSAPGGADVGTFTRIGESQLTA